MYKTLACCVLVGQTVAGCAAPAGAEEVRSISEPVRLFAVSRPDPSDPGLVANPIVVFKDGTYTDPLHGSADAEAFLAMAFAPGREYRVLSGGMDAGRMTAEGRACGNCAEAWVSLQAKVRPAGQVMVLATDAPRVARASGFRRPPTAEERAIALDSARQAFERHGVSPVDLKVVNLTATDVDGDGRAELFGSYSVGLNNLFQFLEPGPAYANVIERFNRADDSAQRQMDERLVDHADLDGDGIGEVVTIRGSSEGFDYAIYQKKDGRWRQVYEGGG